MINHKPRACNHQSSPWQIPNPPVPLNPQSQIQISCQSSPPSITHNLQQPNNHRSSPHQSITINISIQNPSSPIHREHPPSLLPSPSSASAALNSRTPQKPSHLSPSIFRSSSQRNAGVAPLLLQARARFPDATASLITT